MATDVIIAQPEVEAPASGKVSIWIPLSLLAIYLIWGSTYLVARIGLQSFPPFFLTGTRYLIAGLILFIALRIRGVPVPNVKQSRNAALIGALMLVGGTGGVVFAEQAVASGLAALLIATVPLWAMLFSGLWGNWPTRYEWIGLALGLLGVALLSLEGNLQANPIGVIILLVSASSWGFGSVLSRHVVLPPGPMGNAVQMILSGLLLYLMSFLRGEQIKSVPNLASIAAIAYLVVFGSLIAFNAYMYLLKTVRPALATSYAFVNPAIALLLGVVLAGEQITGSALLALPIILVGVAIVALKRK